MTWIAARRFGVAQGFKTDDDGEYLLDDKGQKIPRIRQIDDFSEYFVNACTTVEDKIPVAGVDAIANHAKLWSDKIQQGRSDPNSVITMSLSNGEILRGALHEDFKHDDTKLVGKCLDLEPAYKQCPVVPAHARYSVFALKDPTTEAVEFFLVTALPFGATAAVHGFNRAAMALNHLAHHYAGIPCSHYFDDFTVIAPEELAEEIDGLAKQFFEILGWDVKKSKDKPMKEKFTALGVNFDLSQALGRDPKIIVENKEERIREIVGRIDHHLKIESISAAEAAELRGKLVFSNSQTSGRMGALAHHHLGKKAAGSGGPSRLDVDLKRALRWWKEHIVGA